MFRITARVRNQVPAFQVTDQFAQLLQLLRHGRSRIFSRFVLEHDVALVADVTKLLDDPSEIGALLLPEGVISTLTCTTTV